MVKKKTKIRFKRLPSAEVIGYTPDRHKYYAIRTGNSLPSLRKWIRWSLKNHVNPKELLILDYSKTIDKRKDDPKYVVYSTYEDLE